MKTNIRKLPAIWFYMVTTQIKIRQTFADKEHIPIKKYKNTKINMTKSRDGSKLG